MGPEAPSRRGPPGSDQDGGPVPFNEFALKSSGNLFYNHRACFWVAWIDAITIAGSLPEALDEPAPQEGRNATKRFYERGNGLLAEERIVCGREDRATGGLLAQDVGLLFLGTTKSGTSLDFPCTVGFVKIVEVIRSCLVRRDNEPRCPVRFPKPGPWASRRRGRGGTL